MTDELVAYLLDDLCPERRAEVQRRLDSDAAWRGELERLKECLSAPGDPAKCVDESPPPRDLVTRTCCLVNRAGQWTAAAPGRTSRSSSWSLADVTVGGGVLLALGMLMLPALRESRDASRRLACQNNLRVLSTALFDFQRDHSNWLPRVALGGSAGEYVLKLVESGVAGRDELADALVCPDSKLAEDRFAGRANWHIPSREEIDAARGNQRALLIVWTGGSYAYRVGYYDPRRVYRHVRYTGDTNEPILADAPRLSQSGVRSASHGGCGQYVLYQGHHVKYRANSDLAANVENIFLNLRAQHAAGRDRTDVVLVKSGYGPSGRVEELPAISE